MTRGLYRIATGLSNVSSDSWNKHQSTVLANLIRTARAASADMKNGIASATIDTANTTALLIGTLYRPRGALWDDYGDASLDTAKTEVTYGGTGNTPTTSTVEAAGILTAEKTSQGGVGGGTLASSTVIRFLHDFDVSAGARMFNVRCQISAADGDTGSGGGGDETVQITYGNVVLLQHTAQNNAGLGLARYVFFINAAGTSIDIYVDSVFSATVSVAAAADGYFRLESYSYVSDSPRTTQNTIVVYDAYYIDDGIDDTTDYVYLNDSISLDSDMQNILVSVVDTLVGTTTRTVQASFNNGSNWVTVGQETLSDVVQTNSSLKVRIAYLFTDDGDDFSFDDAGYIYG